MGQAVSRQPLSAETRVRSHASQCENWHSDGVFSEYLGFSSVSIIPAVPRTHLHLQVSFTRSANGRSLGNFQKAMIFFEIREHRVEIYFSLLVRL
jgi:hypothetical protein